MHLILDKYSLFSTYDPAHVYRLPYDRHNTSTDKVPEDITTIPADSIDDIALINMNEEYTINFNYN
jgi:hypothetical protein